MSVAERCLALSEMVDKIISFFDENDLINYHSFELHRRRVIDLFNQPLAQEALVRNSGHIRSLYIGTSGLLPVLAAAPPCSDINELMAEKIDMLGPLIRKNFNLTSVQLYGISGVVNLEELHEDLDPAHFDLASVSFSGQASLIQRLAYPHFRLKGLNFQLLIGNLPNQGLTLFALDTFYCEPMLIKSHCLRLTQKMLSILPNLKVFQQAWKGHLITRYHTVVDGKEETHQGRWAKIIQVYQQLRTLTQKMGLTLGCIVLRGSSEVELDFSFGTEPEREWVLKHVPQLLHNNNPLQTRQV
ncbi:MAG: hypothetical protein BYD32DRAFT_465654 [Podila humilis]|nr:MAG: hypothetical protein BYD32DRAFT_465654 [Podila humilis]